MPANTQPIYTGQIFSWNTKLTNLVAPKIITSQSPTLLGDTGNYGALIYNIRAIHLGNNVASVIHFWTKKVEGTDTDYHLLCDLAIAQTSSETEALAATEISYTLPVIPLFGASVKGLYLEKDTELYCALGTAIANGVEVFVTGGLYEQDI